MTTSALLSALRVAGRRQITASTLGARPHVTGSHVFRVHRFTQVKEKVANGAAVTSSPFSVGGHDWRIQCYPNGAREEVQGYISLFLKQARHARSGDATASFNMSILDRDWKPTCTQISIEESRFTVDTFTWGWRDFMKLEDLDKEKHLEDDCLSVLCDVTVDLGLHTDEVAGAEGLARASPPFHLHGLAEAIYNRQEADVKIEARDGETFAAHRWVLESRSPVLKADLALASNSNTVAELRVGDMDADVCKALLQFMYTDSPPPELESSATMAERFLVAADRYELEKLKLACGEALRKNIDTSSVAATLALAERHRCPVLREACMEFLASPGNLHVVLSSSDSFQKLKTGCPSALLDLLEQKPLQEQFINMVTSY